MQFRYQYHGTTQVADSASAQIFDFAPDLLRSPVAFDAVLRREGSAHWQVREALSALHDVVVSDLRTRGRDPVAYKTWLANNEQHMLAQFMQRGKGVKAKLDAAWADLHALQSRKSEVLGPFYSARAKYFNWL